MLTLISSGYLVGAGRDLPVLKKRLRLIKKRVLDKLVHRGYTTGFLFGRDTVEQNVGDSHIGGEEEFVGEVVETQNIASVQKSKKFKTTIRPHNALRVGDKIRIMQPNQKDLRMTIKKMYNEKDVEAGQDLPIESGHGGTGKNIVIYTSREVEEFSILFKQS